MKFCAEGRNERFGVIEFCVGVDVMPEFKAVRFGVVCIAGRVVRHARRLIIRLTKGHPYYESLL